MLYLLKTSLSLAAFYLFYKLLCSRDTWHRQNRVLLLLIFALSAVIPFLYIDLGQAAQEASVIIEELSTSLVGEAVELEGGTPDAMLHPTWWQQIPWRMLLTSLYLAGLMICIAHFTVSLLAIISLIRKSKRSTLPDGTILVTHTKSYGPFSWMRYIIVSERDLSDNSDMILAHERAHIRLHHSWDLLFVQLCATAQWFNPAAWLLKRELEAIHEYEADSETLRQGFDARQYQLRLFEAVVGANFNTITNNFNNCSTKKRIIMMMRTQSNPWTRMKALFVLPVTFVAVAVISCTSPKEKNVEDQEATEQVQPTGIDDVQVTGFATAPQTQEQGEIFMVAEEQPMFPGGMQEMMKFIQSEVKYPKEAQDKGLQGRVIVQFVVNTDGSICEDTVVRSVAPSLDAEAVRVVRSMPNWTPGKQKGEPVRVRFTLPVTFRLDGLKDNPTQVQVTQEKTAEDDIVNVPENIPEYPGGMGELMKYLSMNIRYPKEAQNKGIQGRVVVQFVVNKDGSITDAKVVKAVDPQLDAEALRVVNAMPNWTPGKHKGEAVRTHFTIPVSFKLNN
ncbi:MAG: M56 family metallopeptidase [Bacteroidaceae bacterium]|nr:M56 family metallopeptidase [Bacteroidaceae bacterium]